jgi:hypothetical protein
VTHFFDHDAGDGAAVPVGGSAFEQITLLLHAGEFRITLVHDHVEERVAHLLSRHLAQVLPLEAALVGTKLDFLGLDCAEKRVELEAGNLVVVDADIFAPIVKESYPIAKGTDFRYFARHNTSDQYRLTSNAGFPAGVAARQRAGETASATLLRLEHRRPFLHVCGQAFFGVFALEQELLVLALHRQG